MIKGRKRGGINEYDYIRVIRGDEYRNMYKALANHYLRRFCTMYDFDYNDADWVADEPGGVAMVADYFVGFDELRFAVDYKVPWVMFSRWYDLTMEIHTLESDIRMGEKFTSLVKINFPSYCKGAPLPYTEKELKKLRKKAKRVSEKVLKNGENQD